MKIQLKIINNTITKIKSIRYHVLGLKLDPHVAIDLFHFNFSPALFKKTLKYVCLVFYDENIWVLKVLVLFFLRRFAPGCDIRNND